MPNHYTDDFFREVYNAELENKHKLDSADSFLAVLLLALAGVALYYLRLVPCCGLCAAGCFFIAFGVLYFVAFCGAICSAIGSFFPRDKAYISSPEDTAQYVKGLEEYYANFHKGEEAKNHVDEDLRVLLRDQYVKASEINRKLNIKKMGWQTRARYCLAAAVLLVLLNAWPTYLVERMKTDVQKVDVIKLPETPREDKSDGRRSTEAAAVPTATTTPAKGTPAKTGTSRDRASQGGSDQRDEKEHMMADKKQPAAKPQAPQPAPVKPPAPGITKLKATGTGPKYSGPPIPPPKGPPDKAG